MAWKIQIYTQIINPIWISLPQCPHNSRAVFWAGIRVTWAVQDHSVAVHGLGSMTWNLLPCQLTYTDTGQSIPFPSSAPNFPVCLPHSSVWESFYTFSVSGQLTLPDQPLQVIPALYQVTVARLLPWQTNFFGWEPVSCLGYLYLNRRPPQVNGSLLSVLCLTAHWNFSPTQR